MSGGFDPNSTDAVFARILQRLDAQDAALQRIETGVNKTNGRVNSLERDKWYQRGVVATISVLAAGVFEFLKSK